MKRNIQNFKLFNEYSDIELYLKSIGFRMGRGDSAVIYNSEPVYILSNRSGDEFIRICGIKNEDFAKELRHKFSNFYPSKLQIIYSYNGSAVFKNDFPWLRGKIDITNRDFLSTERFEFVIYKRNPL